MNLKSLKLVYKNLPSQREFTFHQLQAIENLLLHFYLNIYLILFQFPSSKSRTQIYWYVQNFVENLRYFLIFFIIVPTDHCFHLFSSSSEQKLFGQKFSTHFHVIGHLYSRWECGTSSILQTRIQGHRSLHQPSSILWNRLWPLYINQTPNNLWSWAWGGTIWNIDEKLHQIYQTWNTARQGKWTFHTFRCWGKQNEVRHVLYFSSFYDSFSNNF